MPVTFASYYVPVDDLARQFAAEARQYCAWIENDQGGDPRAFARRGLVHLVRLYQLALELPDPAPGAQPEKLRSIEHGEWNAIHESIGRRLPEDLYWEIFNPLPVDQPSPDPVVGSLADDLADVWRDLRRGLDAIEAVQSAVADPETILWHWRWTFAYHWGRHASAAIRVLHDICAAGATTT